MARLHPPRFPYANVRSRGAERRFFDACATQLDDSWSVIYAFPWNGLIDGGRRVEDSDADFVLLHPEIGIFVVEVKGGQEIDVDQGDWFSTPHGGTRVKIKNPFSQAAESKRVIRDEIMEKVPGLKLRGAIGHFVCFPGHIQVGDMSAQARRELIVDKDDLRDLENSIRRVAKYQPQAHKLTKQTIDDVWDCLLPTFHLIGSRNEEIDASRDQLEFLTDLQLQTFVMLRNQPQLTVVGGAGTGKTILAYNQALFLASQGLKVIYHTTSPGLIDWLTHQIQRDIPKFAHNVRFVLDSDFFREFVKFAYKFLDHRRSQETNSIEPQIRDDIHRIIESGWMIFPPELVKEVNELHLEFALESLDTDDDYFDCVIIDEAQNVPRSILAYYDLLLRDSKRVYVFGDPRQENHWNVHPGLVPLNVIARPLREPVLTSKIPADAVILNVNCRSTTEISRFASRLIGTELDNFGVSGPQVQIEDLPPDVSQWEDIVSGVAEELINDYGIRREEIAVIWPNRVHGAYGITVPSVVLGSPTVPEQAEELPQIPYNSLDDVFLPGFTEFLNARIAENPELIIHSVSFENPIDEFLNSANQPPPSIPSEIISRFLHPYVDEYTKQPSGSPLERLQEVRQQIIEKKLASGPWHPPFAPEDKSLLRHFTPSSIAGLDFEAVILVLEKNQEFIDSQDRDWRVAVHCGASRARLLLRVLIHPSARGTLQELPEPEIWKMGIRTNSVNLKEALEQQKIEE